MPRDVDIVNRLLKKDLWSGYTQFKKFVGRKTFDNSNVRLVMASVAPVEYQPFSLGANIVMSVANSIDDVFVDKSLYFFDAPCRGFVSQQPISKFDIVGVSMYMPFQAFGLPHYLSMNGLHPLARERKKLPIVVMGGQLFSYFHLVWDYVDVICIGEGEKFIQQLIDIIRQYKTKSKTKILTEIAQIQGALVPAFYKKDNDLSPLTTEAPYPVTKTYLTTDELGQYSLHNENHLFAKKSKMVVELARGCHYQCSFCLLARQMFPYREKHLQDVQAVVKRTRRKITIYPFAPDEGSVSWRNKFAQFVTEQQHNIFRYNFRLNTFTNEDAPFIKKIVSFGLDAISPRILRVTSKCVSFENLFQSAQYAFEHNIACLKLNLVISFPFETDEDWLSFHLWLNTLADLRDKIQTRTRKTTIELHPTPFLPLQWTPMFFLPARYHVEPFLRIYENTRSKLFSNLSRFGYPLISVEGLQHYDNWLLSIFLARNAWLASEFVWYAYLNHNITPKFSHRLMKSFYQFARQKKLTVHDILNPIDPEQTTIFDAVDWSGGNIKDPPRFLRNQHTSLLRRLEKEFKTPETDSPSHPPNP